MIPEVSANLIVQQATSAPSHSTDLLASHFANLLAQEPPPMVSPPVGAPNVASFAVSRYETSLHELFNEVQSFSVQAPRMDPQELVGRQIELQYHMAQVSMQNNAVIYAAQSSKNGLSTLMKNQ